MADLFGGVVGDDADPARLLDEIVERAGANPISTSRRHVSYREAIRYLDGHGPLDEWGEELIKSEDAKAGVCG